MESNRSISSCCFHNILQTTFSNPPIFLRIIPAKVLPSPVMHVTYSVKPYLQSIYINTILQQLYLNCEYTQGLNMETSYIVYMIFNLKLNCKQITSLYVDVFLLIYHLPSLTTIRHTDRCSADVVSDDLLQFGSHIIEEDLI